VSQFPLTGQWKEMGDVGGDRASFLYRLAMFHDFHVRWQNMKKPEGSDAGQRADLNQALFFIRQNRSNVFGWALLCLIQDKVAGGAEPRRALAETFRLFEDVPGLGYVARYERARHLSEGGRYAEARTVLRELHAKTLEQGILPAIDASFKQIMHSDPN